MALRQCERAPGARSDRGLQRSRGHRGAMAPSVRTDRHAARRRIGRPRRRRRDPAPTRASFLSPCFMYLLARNRKRLSGGGSARHVGQAALTEGPARPTVGGRPTVLRAPQTRHVGSAGVDAADPLTVDPRRGPREALNADRRSARWRRTRVRAPPVMHACGSRSVVGALMRRAQSRTKGVAGGAVLVWGSRRCRSRTSSASSRTRYGCWRFRASRPRGARSRPPRRFTFGSSSNGITDS
jgi:hypothetical protein